MSRSEIVAFFKARTQTKEKINNEYNVSALQIMKYETDWSESSLFMLANATNSLHFEILLTPQMLTAGNGILLSG